jgi:hypothetical protein
MRSGTVAGARRFVARVSVHHADAVVLDGGTPGARVLLTLELTPLAEELPLRETGLASVQLDPAKGTASVDQALRGAVSQALEDAARALGLRLDAAAKDDARLERDLTAEQPEVRDVALVVLAERKHPAAVDPLVARLGHPDPDVADRAVGALAEIGDRRAVGPLIDFAHRRGRGMEQLARIVGDLGGPEARAWLETLAVGHPDAEVRAVAAESLSALAAREARLRAAAR